MSKISRRGNKPVFTGIVAVGDNKTSACNAYRSAVLEQKLSLFSESNALVALAGSGMYSPSTGRKMTTANQYANKLSSVSSGDGELDDVSVHISVCTDGCKSVLVSDNEIDFCTVCSAALPELTDAEAIEALVDLESVSTNLDSDENYMGVQGNQGLVVVASSFAEAQSLFAEACQDTDNCVHLTDGDANYATHVNCVTDYSPFTGEASYEAEEEDEEVNDELTSISSAMVGGEAEAHYLVCIAGCKNGHILTTNENSSYCPTCSGGLVDPEVVASLSSLDDLDDEDSLEIEDDEDFEDEDFESDSSADEDDDFDEDFEDEEDFEEDDFEDDEDFESDSSADEDDFEEDDFDDEEDFEEDDFDDEEDFESDSSAEEDEELDLDDLEDDLADLEDEEDDFESESSVEVNVNFLDAFAGNEPKPELVSFSNVGTIQGEATWLAFYNGMPVARALQSKSSNQSLFNSPKFGEAALVAVSSQGLTQALEDFNFEVLNPEVDLRTAVSSQLVKEHQQELAEVQTSVDNEVAEVKERFGAALSTSMAAINRNLVKGKHNPIVNSLVASLRAAGVSTAEQLVSQSFEQHSDAFLNDAIDHALSLMSKSADAQNEYAEMVATASFASQSSAVSGVTIGQPVQTEAPKQEPKLASESSAATTDFEERLARSMLRLGF